MSVKQRSLSILHGNKAPPQHQSLSAAVKQILTREDLSHELALRHGDATMTFGQLKAKVHALCHKLQSVLGSKRGNEDGGESPMRVEGGDDEGDQSQDDSASTIVAFYLPPGFERVTAMLACFCAHLAYLPLDESLPESRMELMFEETQPVMLLTEGDASEAMKSVCSRLGVTMLHVHDVTNPDTAYLEEWPEVPPEENPLACVLYTSGSTGVPKGVRLRSANIMNRLEWCWRAFPFSEEAMGCHKTSLLFVDSLTEILSCLLKGIPLQIFDSDTVRRVDKFNEELLKYKVTRIVLVPSLLKAMLDIVEMNQITETLATLNFVVCSGEALSVELASKFFRIVPTAVLLNFYGSTETSGDVTYEIVQNATDVAQKQYNGCISLGSPIDCNKVYILDEELKILPRGMTGEIAVSGVNVCDSYVKAGDSSSSSNFLPNVFCSDKAHSVIYRMGDLGRIINDRLYYEGRNDSQVKIRGKRVNLLEVENAIKRMPDVQAVVVLCATRSNASAPWNYEDKVPVAFVQMLHEDKTKSHAVILEACSNVLAAYMVPQVVIVDALPLQSHTGKVDRQKLLELYTPDICGSGSALGIISEHLRIQESLLDLSLTYTDLGGSSLSAVSTVVALSKAGYPISLHSFLSAPSISHILQLMDQHDPPPQDNNPDAAQATSPFQIEMLHLCPDIEAALDLLALEFASKNPLDALAQSSVDSFRRGVTSILKEVLDDKLSIVVRHSSTGALCGVCINVNARTELFPEFDKEEVIAINEAVEGAVRVEVLQDGGQWIDSFLMAVADTLDRKESVHVIKMMETSTYELGEERGFDGIITVNSHPLTAMIAEQEFGYTIRKSLHVKSFEYAGRMPFHQAPNDYYIHCMTKHIARKQQD